MVVFTKCKGSGFIRCCQTFMHFFGRLLQRFYIYAKVGQIRKQPTRRPAVWVSGATSLFLDEEFGIGSTHVFVASV